MGREVRDIVGLVLQRPIADGEAVDRATEPAWDSLKHVEILFAIEDSLGVHFAEEEMPGLNSLDAIEQAVRQRNAA